MSGELSDCGGIKAPQLAITKQKDVCVAHFASCKRAEDQSVPVIAACLKTSCSTSGAVCSASQCCATAGDTCVVTDPTTNMEKCCTAPGAVCSASKCCATAGEECV